MNRSFHAFAVLLVSLAGGMMAATWTSMLPAGRQSEQVTKSASPSATHYCSCNPESQVRFEQGCARDKTTGELYGCGLGLGNNGATGTSILSRTANAAVDSLSQGVRAVHQGIAGIPWGDIGVQAKELDAAIAALNAGPAPETDRSHEQDYAAAELAAAGFDPSKAAHSWLNLNEHLSTLHRAIAADTVRQGTESIVLLLGKINSQWERNSREWLVEMGLDREWANAKEIVRNEQLTIARMQLEEDNFERWFDNFPPPVTRPNRLINPIETKDDAEESRRIMLATAKVLETLSGVLHQTAENLARQAEQDVAESNKLKSGIEERR